MKRPSLTAQLFLAVLATAVAVALAMGAAAHWSFDRGFIGYLNAQAVARMDAVLPRLQQAYAQRQSWDFVRNRPEVWFDLVGVGRHHPLPGDPPADASADASRMPSSPSTDPAGAPPLPPAERALIESDLLGAGRRLTLLDAQRQRVIGFPFILAGTVQREIVVNGRTAGWLAIAPVDAVTDEAALRFLRGQLNASLATGAVAVLLAALIAWWVARTLLAPVREVAAATHRLAAGRHDTRVPVRGHDEVAQLAQDFNALAMTLERTEQMRRDFMADVSHELRTPLAVLRGELEALEDGIHEPTPEHLQLLQAEVRQLAQLVNDLHELALADVGALSYRKADLDLGALLAEQLTAFAHRCEERGLAFEPQLPAAPVPVLADAARLRQLLHNLLANSLRYTDAPGRVVLRLTEDGGDGEWAVIDLEDSAPGVPEEALQRLFERFFRVEASRSRAQGGSGLGLAICRSIVQAHGGRIEARASGLGGLGVRVWLPRVRYAVNP